MTGVGLPTAVGLVARLGLSQSTVKHHLANARSKVGVATTAQLVWSLAPRLPEPEPRPSGRLITT